MNVQTTGPAGRTLYMLDDNADFCATAKWWLAGAGYEVIDFQDAHLAIEALKGLDARAIGRAISEVERDPCSACTARQCHRARFYEQ